jgi:hypothetical protein
MERWKFEIDNKFDRNLGFLDGNRWIDKFVTVRLNRGLAVSTN